VLENMIRKGRSGDGGGHRCVCIELRCWLPLPAYVCMYACMHVPIRCHHLSHLPFAHTNTNATQPTTTQHITISLPNTKHQTTPHPSPHYQKNTNRNNKNKKPAFRAYSAADQAQVRQHVDQLYACVGFCANEVWDGGMDGWMRSRRGCGI
jgi:hypothetical protein